MRKRQTEKVHIGFSVIGDAKDLLLMCETQTTTPEEIRRDLLLTEKDCVTLKKTFMESTVTQLEAHRRAVLQKFEQLIARGIRYIDDALRFAAAILKTICEEKKLFFGPTPYLTAGVAVLATFGGDFFETNEVEARRLISEWEPRAAEILNE